uniref:Uncharacterized protein n=1 Tax=Onchocerca volvulus TaxID=6282 RepID=A0A8R1XM10_ONCVO
MSILNCSNSEDITIAIVFLIIACLIISGHVIHVPSPHVFKSRVKGQVACFSCVSFTNDFNPRQFYDTNFKFNTSTTALHQTLEKGGILIPKRVPTCVETYFEHYPKYHQMDVVFCPNTAVEPGSCVTLKGTYNGNQYIYRNCWSKMWIEKRSYAQHMSERCYDDELVQNFVATNNNKICFCEDDLCNSSNHDRLSNDLCFIILFVIFLYLY